MTAPRLIVAALLFAAPLPAQGYRFRLDGRVQAVEYRGVQLDSIAVGDTVTGPAGGSATADGFAVRCPSGAPYCFYFRPGAVRRGAPFVATADVALWGLGIRGFSAHATARAAVDFTGAGAWPGTDPALQLINGYVEYSVERLTLRAGRQQSTNRLGTIGFDGGELVVRGARPGLEGSVYGGWGLARGVALPVTSPALNPIDDFQPSRRQLLFGAAAGWSSTRADARADYLREVDPRSDYFVSERLGLAAVVRAAPGWSLSGGADYDLAAGWWGSAEATVGYATTTVNASLGARRYRPHFELWTIWGAFSPVPYRAIQAHASVRALPQVQLRARAERYRFDDAAAATPLVDVVQSGSRVELGVTVSAVAAWTLDAGYHREFGPGAAAVGTSASVTYTPSDLPYSIVLHGASLDRPLELRFSESVLRLYGIDARLQPNRDIRVELGAVRYAEDRRRPDAATMDWGQWRVTLHAVLAMGTDDDLQRLPPGRRRLPGGRVAR